MRQAQDFPFISHSPRRWASYVNSRNPMPETIIPLDSRGRRDWKAMGDCEIVRFAKDTINSKGVTSRNGVAEADPGLYDVLRGRKLLDEVGLPDTKVNNRDWAGMGDEELVAHAKGFVGEKGIKGRGELKKADAGLYDALRKRKLLDETGISDSRGERRDWASMGDKELVGFAKRFIAKRLIKWRGELAKEDPGLYDVLRRRELLDDIGIENRNADHRDLRSMGDDEVVSLARRYYQELGVTSRSELGKADSALYNDLRRRNALDKVGFERNRREWSSVGDENIVSLAQKFIDENGIKNKKALVKADAGLSQVLHKRKLIDRIGFERQERVWGTDEELIAYARAFIEEKGIRSRNGLAKADLGLYASLNRRKLLDELNFTEKRREWGTDEEVLAFARKLIAEKEVRGRKGLIGADQGLYAVLWKRKLLDKTGLKDTTAKYRDWAAMGDGEIVSLARRIVEGNGLKNRKELTALDSGLSAILWKRKLLDKVGLEGMRPKWGTDEEVLGKARKKIEELGITDANELAKADKRLYSVLRKRNLLGQMGFETKPRGRRKWGTDEEVVAFARMFIKRTGIRTRSQLAKADTGLYSCLWVRGLIDKIGLESLNANDMDWALMKDDEIVSFAGKYVEENGIRNRSGLSKAAKGLYNALLKRALLDRVFPDIDTSERIDADGAVLRGIKGALGEYSGDGK